MHTPIAVVVLDNCPVYSIQIIRDSSQPKRAGSISNLAEIPHPSPLADTPILTRSSFYLTLCFTCANSGFVLNYSYFSAVLLWQILYSSVFVWLTPRDCELQNGPRGFMFGLSTQWNSTASSFLTPPPSVWLLLYKPIFMLGGCIPRLSILCSTSREAQKSSVTQDLGAGPLMRKTLHLWSWQGRKTADRYQAWEQKAFFPWRAQAGGWLPNAQSLEAAFKLLFFCCLADRRKRDLSSSIT